MPTRDRRAFVPAAIRYFLRQDYPCKELIIVDDGDDAVGDLIPADDRIRYLRLNERSSIGKKRNLACAAARGTYIAHWDDDDWHAANRLTYQVQSLERNGAAVCGLGVLAFYDARSQRAWRYRFPNDAFPQLACGTLLYERALSREHYFADVDAGEEARFLWGIDRKRCLLLDDSAFYIATLHAENAGAAVTRTAWWDPIPLESLERALGDEWRHYVGRSSEDPAITGDRVRNVYACLVHESPECIVDLVRNLRHNDPASTILLYNGGASGVFGDTAALERLGAIVHPSPRPMRWGSLHAFALESMRFALEHIGFDTITIVDSDQLSLRADYTSALSAYFAAHPATGMLGSAIGRQPRSTAIGPARQAWREYELWRPFLRRFPNGEQLFPQWTFWPGTVFTASTARGLTEFTARDAQFSEIMARTTIWATEEVILPTLTALLGFTIDVHPTSNDYVQFRIPYSIQDAQRAIARPDVYWMHPVPRSYDDPLRAAVRERFDGYCVAGERSGTSIETPLDAAPIPMFPILERMRQIAGWFDDEEAELLAATVARAFADAPAAPVAVEVGSYCGRSTIVLGCTAKALRPDALIFAVDPHAGELGTAEGGSLRSAPTLDAFRASIDASDIKDYVREVVAKSTDVAWTRPIDVLLIDGLHDYASVAADFAHFAPFIIPGGYVAFHDYAPYFPGVMAFVDKCIAGGTYLPAGFRKSLMVLRRIREVV